MANATEIAYIAGLFDGEGCVATYFHTGRYAQVIPKVAMTDPRPLTAIAHMFGGTVRRIKDNRKPHYKPQFEWAVYGKKAKAFFEAIRPYAIVKRDQIELAIELLNLIGSRGAPYKNLVEYPNATKREKLVTNIRAFNSRRFEEVA